MKLSISKQNRGNRSNSKLYLNPLGFLLIFAEKVRKNH